MAVEYSIDFRFVARCPKCKGDLEVVSVSRSMDVFTVECRSCEKCLEKAGGYAEEGGFNQGLRRDGESDEGLTEWLNSDYLAIGPGNVVVAAERTVEDAKTSAVIVGCSEPIVIHASELSTLAFIRRSRRLRRCSRLPRLAGTE